MNEKSLLNAGHAADSAPNFEQLQRIVIVGGGSAGWMAAAYLGLSIPCDVALVESPQIGTVGVGEATIPALLDFIESLDFDEDEVMRRCGATYKLGIEFRGWTREGHSYFHPFGQCGGRINGLDLFHFWRRNLDLAEKIGPYSYYSFQALLAAQGRSHRPIAGRGGIEEYAFHLDAQRFADFLREKATSAGVEHIQGEVVRVDRDQRGHLSQVVLDDGREIRGDLFIDCTGFAGVLCEQEFGDKWIDWSNELLCDRALVLRRNSEADVLPYTIASTGTAGWSWKIPLSDRIGYGYVHSSRHISQADARLELSRLAGAGEDAEMRELQFRVGRRTRFWSSNCIALGLSAGFVEPLESTGIFLVQRGLEVLLDLFPDRHCSPPLANEYNRRLGMAYDEVRDFVLLHYVLTGRNEPFWQDARGVALPSSLAAQIECYEQTGLIHEADRDPVFRATNYFHIYSGGERLPRRPHPQTVFTDMAKVQPLLAKIRSENNRIAETLPSHSELLKWLHS